MWEAWEWQDSFVVGWVQKHRFLHSADNFSRSISFTWRSGSSCGANLVPSIASRLPRQLYRSSSIERRLGSGRYLCLRTPSESPNSWEFLILTPGSRLHGSETLLLKVSHFQLVVEQLLTTRDLENILFNLPLDEERYQKTLQVLSSSQESYNYPLTPFRSVPWSPI